jgi:hypothetical protein
MPDFSHIVKEMKDRYRLRVRRWRRQMSGCAWSVFYHDGRRVNWIESPYPKTPISLAIFLHEVGHHAVGFRKYKLRCEEEYHVWQWAFRQMRRLGVTPDDKVSRRFGRSIQYVVRMALRQGMEQVPESLLKFIGE